MMELRPHGLPRPAVSPNKPIELSPLDVLLAAMHARWAAGDHDAAVSLAAKAAPYVHPRAPATPPQQDMRRITDGQLDFLCDLDGRPAGENNSPSGPDEVQGLG